MRLGRTAARLTTEEAGRFFGVTEARARQLLGAGDLRGRPVRTKRLGRSRPAGRPGGVSAVLAPLGLVLTSLVLALSQRPVRRKSAS